MRKLRFGVGLEELGRVVSLIDTVVHDRWVRDVPIVPGDPQHLEQWRESPGGAEQGLTPPVVPT